MSKLYEAGLPCVVCGTPTGSYRDDYCYYCRKEMNAAKLEEAADFYRDYQKDNQEDDEE